MKKECSCGEMIESCGMYSHVCGGFHKAQINRNNVLKNLDDDEYIISRICKYDIMSAISCGYSIVVNAFYNSGSMHLRGYYSYGILSKKSDDWRNDIEKFRKQRKQDMNRKYYLRKKYGDSIEVKNV